MSHLLLLLYMGHLSLNLFQKDFENEVLAEFYFLNNYMPKSDFENLFDHYYEHNLNRMFLQYLELLNKKPIFDILVISLTFLTNIKAHKNFFCYLKIFNWSVLLFCGKWRCFMLDLVHGFCK